MLQSSETVTSNGQEAKLERKRRLRSVPFPEYHGIVIDRLRRQLQEGLIEEERFNPNPNAAEILLSAILEVPPIVKKLPYTLSEKVVYPTLSRRGDKHDVFGADDAIHSFVQVIQSEAGVTTPPYHFIVLTAPSGAGKDYLLKTVTQVLEKYTARHPLSRIDGCPIQEDPLNILTLEEFEEEREELQRFGVHIDIPLCPHCRRQYEEGFDGDETKFMVKPLIFNGDSGRGITTIDTNFEQQMQYASDYQELLLQVLGGANRGILIFSEFFNLSEDTRRAMFDLWRDRVWRHNGQVYRLDLLAIALTTSHELEYFLSGVNKSPNTDALKNRMLGVEIPYVTELSEEVKIYKKALGELKQSPPHISPMLLEAAARITVATRLEEPPTKDITMFQKIHAYDGKRISGISDDKVLLLLEKRRYAREGFTGLPPTYMIEFLRGFYQQYRQEGKCPSVTTFLDDLDKYVISTPQALANSKDKAITAISQTKDEIKQWLTNFIYAAFRPDFTQACQTLFDEYILNLKLQDHDPNEPIRHTRDGEILPPNEKFLREIELAANPPISESGKLKFRIDALAKALTLDDLPELGDAIKALIIQGSVGGRVLKALAGMDAIKTEKFKRGNLSFMDEQTRADVITAFQILTSSDFGCCKSCSMEIMLYAAKLMKLSDGQTKKI